MFANPVNTMGGQHLSTPPESVESETSFSSDYPRPQFYIVRPDKTLVPLIAVDEINPKIRLHGVPRLLTANDVDKGNLARVGDQVDRAKEFYRIDLGGPTIEALPIAANGSYHDHSRQSSAVDMNDSTNASSKSEEHDPRAVKAEDANGNTQQTGTGAQQEIEQNSFAQYAKENTASRGHHPSKTKDAATPGIYGKKRFCTYWIRTGNCDYIQEGCKYLHVIPDEETRLRIGIRDMPRWAKEDFPTQYQMPDGKQSPAMAENWRRPKHAPAIAALEMSNTQHHNTGPPPQTVRPANSLSSGHKFPHTPQKQHSSANSHIMAHPSGLTQQNFDPHNQHASPNVNQMGSQTGFNQQSPFNIQPLNPAPMMKHPPTNGVWQNPARSSASFPPPRLPSSTSTSTPGIPPMQPPISRPLSNAYRAPDKMSSSSQATTEALQSLLHGSEPATPDAMIAHSPGKTHLGTNDCYSNQNTTPSNGQGSSHQGGVNTNNSFQYYQPKAAHKQQHNNIMEQLRDMDISSSQANVAAPNGTQDTISGYDGALFGGFSSQTNKGPTSSPQDIRVNFSAERSTSGGNPEVYYHRRRFAGPGQPQVVVTKVEEDKPRGKKNVNGGQHKRTGRGNGSKANSANGKS